MIRKLPALLAFVLLFICFTSSALAIGDASSASKLQDQAKSLQEQKQAAILKIKENAKISIKAKQDEFRTKLQTLKDVRKKTILENVNAKLGNVNEKNTNRFSELLTKLQALLDKAKLTATDTKTIAVLDAAQIAIDMSKTAVADQAANEYVIQITDETALKANANMAISQLKKDLASVHKLVIDAKRAVQLLKTDKNTTKNETADSVNL